MDSPVDDVDHRAIPCPSTCSSHQQQKMNPKVQTMEKTPAQTSLRRMTPSPPIHRKKKKESHNQNQASANTFPSGIPPSFFYNYATESVLDKLFSKKKELPCGNARPPTHCICSDAEDCNWDVPELVELKTKLNKVKSGLDNFVLDKWHWHTKAMNPAGLVMKNIRSQFRPEYCSQAWCKFYECLGVFPHIIQGSVRIREVYKNDKKTPVSETSNGSNLPDNESPLFTSAHLCEAPGAFISALNHYIYTTYPNLHWDWISTSLSPYWEGNSVSEMINDDILMQSSMKSWSFLADGTGNIISKHNIEDFVQTVRKKFGEVNLVTADGSIDCQLNPCEQEKMVVQLHFAEIVTALSVLGKGGSFVLKIFTYLEAPTIAHLYLLSCLFRHLHLFKPATSKEGNSEVYVICLNYIGVNPELLAHLLNNVENPIVQAGITSIFQKYFVSPKFLTKLVECARFFVETQIHVIWKNIQSFQDSNLYHRLMFEVRMATIKTWLETFAVRPLPKTFHLFKNFRHNWIEFVDPKERKFITHAQEIQRASMSLTPLATLELIGKDLIQCKKYLQQRLENVDEGGQDVAAVIKHRGDVYCSQGSSANANAEQTAAKLRGHFRLLSVNFGFSKPYLNVNCSRFCSARLLEQRRKIRHLVETSGMDFDLAERKCSCCTDRESLLKSLKSILHEPSDAETSSPQSPELLIMEASDFPKDKSKSAVFLQCFHVPLRMLVQVPDIQMTFNSLQQLLNLVLISLQKSESMFLCSFPLLTRLHIGILFCLIMHFEQVHISSSGIFLYRFRGLVLTDDEAVFAAKEEQEDQDDQEGATIDLYMDFRPHWEKLRAHISVLPSSLTSNPDPNMKVLLECLPLHRLYKSQYCNVIYAYNISQVVSNVEQYIAECKEIFKKSPSQSSHNQKTETTKPLGPLKPYEPPHRQLKFRN